MSPPRLTAKTLQGVYCFVPVPWDEKGNLDEQVLRHDLAYLCGTAIHGLYTTDSSGEFYALEFPEFCRFVDIVSAVVKPAKKRLQVGCTWTDTRGALRRAEYAAAKGADAIKFAFPYWQKLSLEEALDFMQDLTSAAGEVPLVHYNSPNAKLVFGVPEYRLAIQRVPSLIGTKMATLNPIEIAGLIELAPELSHFAGEYVFASAMAAGARGIYSWLGATNPELAVKWYDACVAGDWKLAMEIQVMVNRWKIHVKSRWSCASDAAVNKLDAAVNPRFRCSPRLRPPYASGTNQDIEDARRWAVQHMSGILSPY